MSFQGLISGSECAAPANPLSQVLKRTEGDRSLQQDRVSGPSSSRLHQLPTNSSSALGASEQDRALARQFFSANRDHGFAMPHHSELARTSEINAHPSMNEAWALEQQQQLRAYEESSKVTWAAEFGSPPQIHSPPLSVQHITSDRPEFQQRPSYMPPIGSFASPMSMGMYAMSTPAMQYGSDTNFSIVNQGKGKGREADFEAAFAQVAASFGPIEAQTSRVEEIDNSATSIEDALKKVSLGSEEEKYGSESDFREMMDQLQNFDTPPPKEDIAKWEAQFSQLMSSQRDELEGYGTDMQNSWEGGLGNYEGNNAMQFDTDGVPLLGAYVFEKNNKYMDPSSSRSLLSEAKALLNQNGSLSEAALMLEAAIQQGEVGEGGYESWVLLGETRNMDEREEAGMRALLHGVKIAEESGAPGAGMLSLAISFTNESYDRASHTMLFRWFMARYPTISVPEETIKAMATNSSWDTHDRITDLFLNLARTQHGQDHMDPDLQIGMGVLFYTNGDYNRAQDCFVSALNVRPKDYLLWNRLGSSLSNGSKPEEALGAYREALQLRPTYTRAIYNVGVACLNIGADKEAAEHFLSALSLQEATSGDSSDQLWFTLRRALLSMRRSDLAELANPEAKSSLDIFRREGFDF